MKRRFTHHTDLPPHYDGLVACWCGGRPIPYVRSLDGRRHIQFFHNDDIGYAFNLVPLPMRLAILAVNINSDDYCEEPAEGNPRLRP